MEWIEILIQIPACHVQEAEAIAGMVVPYGMYIEDYSSLEEEVRAIAHIDLIDESLLEKSRETARIHLYLDSKTDPAEAIGFLRDRFTFSQIPFEIVKNQVLDEDWGTAWQKYYHAVHVGKHMVIRPAWEDYQKRPDELVLSMNPGMAFGTGTHETTRLCLGKLEEIVWEGCTLLDVGSGSGILSIAGVLLGAERALGVDIDELAVKVASENAALNHISPDCCRFVVGDLNRDVTGVYDIVCANLVADAVQTLSKTIQKHMHPKSIFLCSGILRRDEQEVLNALQQAGLAIQDVARENDWTAIECVCPTV